MSRRRYTARANPGLQGETVPWSVRMPKAVADEVDAMIARGRPGIETRSDAVQDAVVVWAMLEEAAEHRENGKEEET